MSKKGITTDRGDTYRKIEEANRQIEALERALETTEDLIREEHLKIPQFKS